MVLFAKALESPVDPVTNGDRQKSEEAENVSFVLSDSDCIESGGASFEVGTKDSASVFGEITESCWKKIFKELGEIVRSSLRGGRIFEFKKFVFGKENGFSFRENVVY